MAVAYNVIIHVCLMSFLLRQHNLGGGGGGGGEFHVLLQKQGNFVLHFTMCM